MAFIAYYFHWSQQEIMELDHRTRRRWCAEISKINKTISGDSSEQKSIFDLF